MKSEKKKSRMQMHSGFFANPVSLERLGRGPLILAKKKSLNATCVQTQSGGGDGGIRTHVPISRQNDFELLTGEIPPVRSGAQECRPGSRKILY